MRTVSKTFRLSREAVAAMDDLVSCGRARSQTALVEELIRGEKTRVDMIREEERLDAQWAEAMQSSEYRAELEQVDAGFAGADQESARSIA